MSSYVKYKICILNLEICVLKGSHNAYVLHNPTFLGLYQCDNAIQISP